MASGDSRPFASLKQNAADFQNCFQKDIESCILLLDNKITELVRDPDNLDNSFSCKKTDAHLEFSKAKFNIFLSMKTFFNQMEEKWVNDIADMKREFLENVEIFLAGTKLEVKLPSKPTLESIRSRLSVSPRSKQDSTLLSMTSSVYPLISSIAKKVPLLSTSSLKNEYDLIGNENLVFSSPQKKQNSNVVAEESSESDSDSSSIQEVVVPALKVTRRNKNPALDLHSIVSENIPVEKAVRNTRRGVCKESAAVIKTPAKESIANKRQTAKSNQTPGKNSRRKTIAIAESTLDELECEADEEIIPSDHFPSSSRRRKTVFVPQTMNQDLLELECKADEEIIPSDHFPSSSRRRKTVFVPQTMNQDLLDHEISPVKEVRSRSKRKTMSCVSDVTVVPPPKRLKTSGRKNMNDALEDDTKNNLLECDEAAETENYTSWMPLSNIDGKLPTTAGIYELKNWRAKKSAFIGSCENLRSMLTLHKLKQNSGHKHLDKFLERNLNDVHVRYEGVSSIQIAKEELKRRIKNFVELYKTTPAYN